MKNEIKSEQLRIKAETEFNNSMSAELAKLTHEELIDLSEHISIIKAVKRYLCKPSVSEDSINKLLTFDKPVTAVAKQIENTGGEGWGDEAIEAAIYEITDKDLQEDEI